MSLFFSMYVFIKSYTLIEWKEMLFVFLFDHVSLFILIMHFQYNIAHV